MITKLKILLRPIYYLFIKENSVVTINNPIALRGRKWIRSKNYGSAYYKGNYEPKLTNFFSRELTKDAVFFDIGAHIGYFSLLASSISPSNTVMSFEPMPNNFSSLKSIKEANNLDNWKIFEVGISDTDSVASFKFGKSSSTGKFLSTNDGGDTVISVRSVDSIISEQNVHPTHMKIDVEGFGDKVLSGCKNLLSNKVLPKIIMEIHNENELNAVNTFLKGKYLFFDMDNKPLGDQLDSNSPNHIIAIPK